MKNQNTYLLSQTMTTPLRNLAVVLLTGSWMALGAGFASQVVHAETMSSDSYKIQFGNFNMTSGEKSSASYKVTDTVGQTAAGAFTGSGYQVKAGFQYIYPFEKFSFTISSLTINLGDLTYGSFNSESHTVTVNTNGAGGYLVTVFETHPLRLQSGFSTIPDTTCDDGSCSETTASSWIDATKPGFGFNVFGDDVATDFVNMDYFRQFADLSNNEEMQTIMSGSGIARNRSATITYKAAPQGTQAAGVYETQIIYSAIPAY